VLLDHGVPVDARYEHDLTALMWAAGAGSESTVQALLERGADASLRDDRGLTAGEIAGKAGHTSTAGMLTGRSPAAN
jgi:ankyrin repeat protein